MGWRQAGSGCCSRPLPGAEQPMPPLQCLTCTHAGDAQHPCGASHEVRVLLEGGQQPSVGCFSIYTPASPLEAGQEHLRMAQSVFAAAREKDGTEGVTGGKTFLFHYSPSISATAGLTPRDQQKALFSLPLPVIHQFYCSTKPPL